MYQMIKKEAIIKVLEARGPLIPVHMKKELGASDTIIVGAILSELVSEGKVKMTSTKIGGSPAYYVPGTESRITDLIKYLNEKDRRSVELLQQKKILKDSEQTPLVRVSLRSIKDFAKPLEANIKGQKEIYWKWYLVPAEEAEQLIMKKEKLTAAPEVKKEEAVDVKPLPKQVSPVGPATSAIEKTIEKAVEKETIAVKIGAKEEKVQAPPTPAGREKKQKEKKEQKEPRKEEKATEVQTSLGKSSNLMDLEKDAFFKQVRSYLEKNEITILDYKIVKKSEIDLFVNIPSRIGSQEYYCKAKNKKKINDGDLSSAYMQGQSSKLPMLFLTPGELSKKAKEMLGKEFKGMTVKTI